MKHESRVASVRTNSSFWRRPLTARTPPRGKSAVSRTAIPWGYNAAAGSTATLPPPAVAALNVGRMTISTGSDGTACVKSAL